MPLAGVVAAGLQLAPVLPVMVAAACPGLGPITVVQTLELLDVQGGEDRVARLSHCRVLGRHHILRGVDSESSEDFRIGCQGLLTVDLPC